MVFGHSKSPYYTTKNEELKRTYRDDFMKYLTFLDYPTLDSTAMSFEAKLNPVVEQKHQEIAALT